LYCGILWVCTGLVLIFLLCKSSRCSENVLFLRGWVFVLNFVLVVFNLTRSPSINFGLVTSRIMRDSVCEFLLFLFESGLLYVLLLL
jgi:hypothetical protein